MQPPIQVLSAVGVNTSIQKTVLNDKIYTDYTPRLGNHLHSLPLLSSNTCSDWSFIKFEHCFPSHSQCPVLYVVLLILFVGTCVLYIYTGESLYY